jgi:protein phosphatase
VYKAGLLPGDALFLCTDGITRYLSDDRIAEVLTGKGAEATVKQLVAEANAAGGSDNITAVAARFRAAEPVAP